MAPSRNYPPLLGWKTGRNDPTLMHNEVVKMRLGRDRDEMDPRQAAAFVHRVKEQGRMMERLAEESVRAELDKKNMGNVDEVVFGRDLDGSGAVIGEEASKFGIAGHSRRAPPDQWNRNFRSEVAEINFGAPPPDAEAMSNSLHLASHEMPHTMRRVSSPGDRWGAEEYSPTRSSLIGGTVFNAGDASRMQGRLADGERCCWPEVVGQPHDAATDSRREGRELRSKARSGSIAFDDGHVYGKASSSEKLGRDRATGAPHAAGAPLGFNVTERSGLCSSNSATTYEFRGPDNPPEWSNSRVPRGEQQKHFGVLRARSSLELTDNVPLDTSGRPVPAAVTWSKRGGANARPPSTFSVAAEAAQPIPPGKYMAVDGSLKQTGLWAGASSIQRDLAWEPERNAAEKNEEHRHRRLSCRLVPKAAQSNVDEVVFGHDIDQSAEVVPEERERELRNGLRLRSYDGAVMDSKRQVCHPESRLGEIAMRWPDKRDGHGDVGRQLSDWELKTGEKSVRRHKGGISEPPAQLLGPLERRAGATFVPSAAAPPRSELLASDVARTLFHSDEDGVARPPSANTSFSAAVGMGPPKKQLSPERLLRGRARGHADALGRAKATSVVDEVVFGKTGADGFIHDQCLQANFTVNQEGDYVKGHAGR